MRGCVIILVVGIGTVVPLQETAHALSPQGIVGGITRPFRQMLGHVRHYPRVHRHRAARVEPRQRFATSEPRAIAPAASPNASSTGIGSHLLWVGPPAWPAAFEDLLGFSFWADGYSGRLRGHGFDVIADTISGRFALPRTSARTAATGFAVNDANSSTNRCGDASSPLDNWPAERVQQVLQLSDAQYDALDKLQAAATQSAKTIRADCRDPGVLTPSDRLRALVQTLWIVRDAGISVREPLRRFYDTLSNTQKNHFVSRQPQSDPVPDSEITDNSMSMNKEYQTCAAQNLAKAERLVKEIEMRVRPNKDQAASLENLHKVSADMAKLLIASCAQPIPVDPMARLDSANDQLTAINYAASTVQIAFDSFYSKLNKDQKARFEFSSR